LKGYEKVLNTKHPSTLDIINNLSNLYADQGKLVKTKKIYLPALKKYEKALGVEYILNLGIVNNSGNLYADQGKLIEAEEIYLRALKGYEKTLDVEHISTLNIVNRSEGGRSSKATPLRALASLKIMPLSQNIAPPLQNIRLLQKSSFKETTAFYPSRSSRGLQDVLTNRPGEMKSLEGIEE